MGQTTKRKDRKPRLGRRLSDGFKRMFGIKNKKTKTVKQSHPSTKSIYNTQRDKYEYPKLGVEHGINFGSGNLKNPDSRWQRQNSNSASSCSTMSFNTVIAPSAKAKSKLNKSLELSFTSDSSPSSSSMQSDGGDRSKAVSKSLITSASENHKKVQVDMKSRSASTTRPMFKINDIDTRDTSTSVTIGELQTATEIIKQAISNSGIKVVGGGGTKENKMDTSKRNNHNQQPKNESVKVKFDNNVYLSQGSQTDPPTKSMIEAEKTKHLLERRKRRMTRQIYNKSVRRSNKVPPSTDTSECESNDKSGQQTVKIILNVSHSNHVELKSVKNVSKTKMESTKADKPKEFIDAASQTDLSFMAFFKSGNHNSVWNQSYGNAHKGVFTSIYPTAKVTANRDSTSFRSNYTRDQTKKSHVKQLDDNTFTVHLESDNNNPRSSNQFNWAFIRKGKPGVDVVCKTGKNTNELVTLCQQMLAQSKQDQTSVDESIIPQFTSCLQQDQNIKVFFNNTAIASTKQLSETSFNKKSTSHTFNSVSPIGSFVASGQVAPSATASCSSSASSTRYREGAGHSKRFPMQYQDSTFADMLHLPKELNDRQLILQVTTEPETRHSVVFDTSRNVYELSVTHSLSTQSDGGVAAPTRSNHGSDPVSVGGHDHSAAGDGPDTRGLPENDEDSLSIDLGIWGNINDTFDLLDLDRGIQTPSLSISQSLTSLSIDDDIRDDGVFLVKSDLEESRKPKIVVNPNLIIFKDLKSCDSSGGNTSSFIDDQWLTMPSSSIIGTNQSDVTESMTTELNCQCHPLLIEDDSVEYQTGSINDSHYDQNAFRVGKCESVLTKKVGAIHRFESSEFSSEVLGSSNTVTAKDKQESHFERSMSENQVGHVIKVSENNK